jgi:hypothetical protein
LNNNSIGAYHARKKPLLSKKKYFVKEGKIKKFLFLSAEYIKRIIFSVERKFKLFGSNRKKFTWRKRGTGLHSKNIIPTIKSGGGSAWCRSVVLITESGNWFLWM